MHPMSNGTSGPATPAQIRASAIRAMASIIFGTLTATINVLAQFATGAGWIDRILLVLSGWLVVNGLGILWRHTEHLARMHEILQRETP